MKTKAEKHSGFHFYFIKNYQKFLVKIFTKTIRIYIYFTVKVALHPQECLALILCKLLANIFVCGKGVAMGGPEGHRRHVNRGCWRHD